MSTMSFDDLIQKYPNIRRANPEDNPAILEFLKNIPMNTQRFDIRYERSPDFFNLIRHQSEKAHVAIFENTDQSIGGIAAFCMRKTYLHGKPVMSGYLSDLRISPKLSRETRIQWRKFYADALKHCQDIREFDHCEYLYSAILDENKAALRAFTRDRSEIVYREIAKYNAVNLMGRIPIPFRGNPYFVRRQRITIRKAQNSDLNSLKDFLAKQNQNRLFGHFFSNIPGDELDRRLQDWDHFRIEDFYLALNPSGNIMATVCPWASHTSRRLVVGRMPLSLKLIGWALKLLGKQPIREGIELKTLYLTHLEFDHHLSSENKSDVFSALLNRIYSDGLSRKTHLISFLDFANDSLMSALQGKGYIAQKTPGTLYQVLHRSHLETQLLTDSNSLNARPPAFEIGIA